MKLDAVGINDFTCPVSIREKTGARRQTIATISLQARMPRGLRGSCVSVFTDILSRYRRDMHAKVFPELLTEVRRQLQAEQAGMEMRFPYFLTRKAPVTGTASLMEYQCSFQGSTAGSHKLLLGVEVPVTTLCPCSKEISEAGAHNQRAEVCLQIEPKNNKFIWLEDLIELVESCGSCRLFSLLKRPDEKYVTETAYNNPMFVEDVVRMAAQKALAHPDIGWFSIGVESFESIHKHSAYAYVDSRDLEPLLP
ncbi:MAG: GTP cyclohydrolase I FolE2 [Desulfobulbus sp.]|nr:MAG: GTP cyclohydrolase I FolE2 [Desulfobulbus sp.]